MNHFTILPEGCISEIISFTTPANAVRSSVISKGFKSAAESDIVWDKFLPSDHQHVVSRSVFPVVFYSKKDLYFRLCESPILLDEGRLTPNYSGNTHLMQIQGLNPKAIYIWNQATRGRKRSQENMVKYQSRRRERPGVEIINSGEVESGSEFDNLTVNDTFKILANSFDFV